MRHISLLSMVFALLVMPSFAQEWRVELRSGPAAPWAAVGVYQTPDAAKQAFVALPLGGTIEGRIVTVGTPVAAPLPAPVVEPPVVIVEEPIIIEEPVTTHPTWYRFGYGSTPLGYRFLHHKKHKHKHEHRHPRPRPDTKHRPKYPPTRRPKQERRPEQRREERRAQERRQSERRSQERSRQNRRTERRQPQRRSNHRRSRGGNRSSRK